MNLSAAQHIPTVRGTIEAEQRPRILLATAEDWIGFSRFPRLLKKNPFDITVLCPANSLIAGTRFVDRVIPVEGDASTVALRLAAELRSSPERYAWCLIGDDDLFRAAAELGADEFRQWFPIDFSADARAFFDSKYVFMERCAEHGLPIADYVVCATFEEAAAAADDLHYPLVVKAKQSIGSSGVTAVADRSELASACARAGYPVALQRFVTGRSFATEVVFVRGVPLWWTTSEQIHRWPRSMGPSSARRRLNVPQMRPILEAFGKFTGYHGVGAIDAILPDDGGPPMLSEMNPRPTPGFCVDDQEMRMFSDAISALIAGQTPRTFEKPEVPADVVAMFPESLYYYLDAPKDRERMRAALASLRRIPFDDGRVLTRITRNFARHVAAKFRVRQKLATLMRGG